MSPPPDPQQAIAAIDEALTAPVAAAAASEAEAKAWRKVRALLGGDADIAAHLHGPATRPEEFIGAGPAAYRYDCSDETIRRRAKRYAVPTILVGARKRFAIRELDQVMRGKKV
jgi:hypothetical protein